MKYKSYLLPSSHIALMMESYATKLKWHSIDYTVAIERDVVASYLEPNPLRIVPIIAIFLDLICMLTGSVHFVEIVAR